MFSEPAIGEKFYGRDEILDILNKRAVALKEGYRQNIALTGQSLSGKSSIILKFLDAIKDDAFVPVYVEVVIEPFRSFACKFIATMLYNSLIKKGEYAVAELEPLLHDALRLFPKTHAAIKHILLTIDKGECDEAYSALLELTSVLKQESGFPCIVIFDEFDNLERLGIKNPFNAFGKVIMVQKDTMYIVSSSRNLAIRKIISEKLSLLFGNFEILQVSNFGDRMSCEFLRNTLSGFDLDDFTKKFIIALTDGNPFYINKIALAIKDKAIERMTSYVDGDIVADALLELVYNPSGTIHQYLMSYLLELLDSKSKDLHIEILISIASGRNSAPEIAKILHIKQAVATDALQRLSEQGLVTKSGTFYIIEDLMLNFWIKHVYDRKKKLLVDGSIDKISIFRNDIRNYVAEFNNEFALPSIERIAELFNLFSNDLVTFDMKSSRMPHFTRVDIKSYPDENRFLAASFRGNYWIGQIYEHDINEGDVIAYIKNVKSLGFKLTCKLMMPLKGIDENAKLLAKELKITIWDLRTINMLLALYGKKRLVVL